jgi:phage gpG-like protein
MTALTRRGRLSIRAPISRLGETVAQPVRVEGLRDFRRDLKRLEPEVEKLLRADIRLIAAGVATEAQVAARSFARSGAYARSIRPYASGMKAQVGSKLPQAAVLHWGGTIRPRGVPITFKPRPVISEALDRNTDRIVNRFGDAVELAARRVGWH